MRCLTPLEISTWLQQTNQIEDPRHSSDKDAYHLAFHAPSNYNYQANECFWESVVTEVVDGNELIIVITDMGLEQASQNFVFDAIRQAINEKRSLIEAPGFSFSYDEREKTVALLSLASCFGWKCYLYAGQGQATFFNWEGEIFDFWTNVESKKDTALRIIENFKLRLIGS
jgi:hypothetical protein